MVYSEMGSFIYCHTNGKTYKNLDELKDDYAWNELEHQKHKKEELQNRIDKATNDMQNYINKQYMNENDIDVSIVNLWINMLKGEDNEKQN